MIYFISNNGVQKGPLTFEQLKGQEINKDTLVWKEGAPDWVKASEVEELVPILELMPPSIDTVSFVTAPDLRINASVVLEQDKTAGVLGDARKVDAMHSAPTKECAEQLGVTLDDGEGKTCEKVIDNTRMFSHFLTFKGRCRRAEYWIVYMISSGLYLMFDSDDLTFGLLLLILVYAYVNLSTAVRRCHDRGLSGFYLLIPFFSSYLFFANSEPGDNKYGNNPKGIYFKGK